MRLGTRVVLFFGGKRLKDLSRHWPIWLATALLTPLIGFFGAVWVVDFPPTALDAKPAESLIVRDAGGRLLRQEMSRGGLKTHWVELDRISPHLVHATLAAEDKNFFSHRGVDWPALGRAAWLNATEGAFAYGGSTITMQLVRLALGTERTVWGKMKQAVLAGDLELRMSKREILEQYLNRVYYGNGAWGAEQAARFYFGKSAKELSAGEAALLAVIPRGPEWYDPFRHLERVLERREHILALMGKLGYLEEADRKLAARSRVRLGEHRTGFAAPHFVEFVKQRLPDGFEGNSAVETTLDGELQRRVEPLVRRHVDELSWRNLTQAAVVVLRNSDGAVLAMVGSRDYWDASHNGAYNGTTARLRPGSALKPFVYGAALERGDTPATMALDVVLPEDAHQFYIKDVRSHGFARYREALAGSYNLSAVHTLQRVGLKAVLSKLRRAGLSTLDRPDDEYDWGLAIGHAEVRLVDLAAAFSTFGRGGRPTVARVVRRARRADGKTWSEPPREGPRIFSREIAYLIFDILSDPDARRPMFGDSVPMYLPFKVALKTGTTKAFTDLWALGTTSEYTVGVWAGNFDGAPTHQVHSVRGATPLLRAVYTAIASRFGDPTPPTKPEAIVSASICPLSGKRPGPYCEHAKKELFLRGTVPGERCHWHRLVCGEPAVVYPPSVRPWVMASGSYEPPRCPGGPTHEPLRIVEPVDGAHFVLEPHRPARLQRPQLAALPTERETTWRIDGTPPTEWIPTPGAHIIEATQGEESAQVEITYE